MTSGLMEELREAITWQASKRTHERIQQICQQVTHPDEVKEISALAISERKKGNRDIALMICNGLVKGRNLRADVLAEVCMEGRDLTDFMGYYWEDGRTPIAKQVKIGLGEALAKLSIDELLKWDKYRTDITLRDIMFLVRPKPKTERQADEWRKFANRQYPGQRGGRR